MADAVIVSTARTPIGKAFRGIFNDTHAADMGAHVIKHAAERAKVELSSSTQTQINLPFITADASGPKHLNTSLTRAKFEQLTADLVERCRGPVEAALADAKLTADEIDEVILRRNYQPRRIEEVFGDGGESGLAIRYVVEPAPLGNGGAIRFATSIVVEAVMISAPSAFVISKPRSISSSV